MGIFQEKGGRIFWEKTTFLEHQAVKEDEVLGMCEVWESWGWRQIDLAERGQAYASERGSSHVLSVKSPVIMCKSCNETQVLYPWKWDALEIFVPLYFFLTVMMNSFKGVMGHNALHMAWALSPINSVLYPSNLDVLYLCKISFFLNLKLEVIPFVTELCWAINDDMTVASTKQLLPPTSLSCT